MKLLNRISLSYIIVSLVFLIVAGCFFFFLFKTEVYEEVDEQLRDEKRNIERLIKYSDTIPYFYPGVNSQVEIEPTISTLNIRLQRKDTVIVHPYEGNIAFRQWRYTLKLGDNNYIVMIRKSLIDLNDLSEKIIYSLIMGFVILLIGLILVNFLLIKSTFKPFYNTLNQLRKYSLNNSTGFIHSKTNTSEFIELNHTIELMIHRLEQDYKKIKEFTENASHEIQTPLAIIQNKLELLMQSDEINQFQAALIQSAYEAVDRLSRLNQSLILLTRIENKEFVAIERVDIGEITKNIILQMEEKLALKELKIKLIEHTPFFYNINKSLAEILISNLLSNAIRYTNAGNEIKINISNTQFIISNPGKPFSVPPEKLFQRFFKLSSSSKSLGIGLSLVKTIADVHDLKITYFYNNSSHSFELRS